MNAIQIIKNAGRMMFAVCALGLPGAAVAANVLYQDVDFFEGKGMHREPFQVNAPGMYKATLADFKFPSSFSSNFGLLAGTSNVALNSAAGSGGFAYQAAPRTYWATLFGVTSAPLGLGLYRIRVEQVIATRLPALLLLASGLAVLFSAGRRGARIARRHLSAEAMA